MIGVRRVTSWFWPTPESTANEVCLRRAVSRLDAVVPHWRKLVNVDVLDMAVPDRCVLGQLYGDYWLGLEHLYDDRHHDSGQLAFAWNFPTKLWRDELRARPVGRIDDRHTVRS